MGRARLNGQSGSKINGIIEEYIVQAGENISAGDFVEFVSANLTASVKTTIESSGSSVKLVLLSSTKVLAITRDYYAPGYTCAQVLTISETTITLGTKTTIVSEAISYFEAIALSETKVLLAYNRSSANSYSGALVILTISGTSILVGSLVIFKTAQPNNKSLTKLSETSALITYNDSANNNYGTARVLTISGTTIALGTEYIFSSVGTGNTSITALSATKVLVNFLAYISSSFRGNAGILSVSGATITVKTPTAYDTTGKLLDIENLLINDSLVLVGAQMGANSGETYPNAFTLATSGDIVTLGPKITTGTNYTWDSLSLCKLSPSTAIISYGDYSSGGYMKNGRACVISLDGNGISAVSNELVYDTTGIIDGISIIPISKSKALVMYSNSSLHIADSRFLSVDNFVKKSLSKRNIHGIAKTKGAAGETVKAFTLAG